MKKSRFTDSQIIDALKRAEAGLAVPELCHELGVSSATFYKWRAAPRHGCLAWRLTKELEEENRRLRKMCRRGEDQGGDRLGGSCSGEAICADARWLNEQCSSTACRSGRPRQAFQISRACYRYVPFNAA